MSAVEPRMRGRVRLCLVTVEAFARWSAMIAETKRPSARDQDQHHQRHDERDAVLGPRDRLPPFPREGQASSFLSDIGQQTPGCAG